MDSARLLAGLDADQRRAVTDPGQPLCILAGAGSGKTRVLTRRIAHRVHEGTADPRHVLALTFTRKAATEMGARLGSLGLRDRPHVGTFHALAWAQLRTWYRDRGRAQPALLESKGRMIGTLPGRGRVPAIEVATEIEWARARDISPADYPVEANREDRRTSTSLEHIASLYAAFEEEKKRRGVVDFDDILSGCARLLTDDPGFATAQRWRFRHLFVDEFQDVNPLQYRLLEGWLGERTDLCVVGDPNQAIYRWNGADAGYLRHFERHHPGATVVELRSSYRSTPQVLHVAKAALGTSGESRLVARRPPGEVPVITAYATDEEEARGIAAAARLLHPPGARWDRQAILVRTNGQMRLFEQALAQARIPFRLRGDDPLLQRADVRAALRQVASDPSRPLRVAIGDLALLADELGGDLARQDSADALNALVRMARDLDAIEPAARVGDLRGWLTTALGSDGPGLGGDAIDVVTFHAAKGLEWKIVHLAGLEDGLVPVSHARSPEAEAEERRLLHVAVTRAEDVLRLSWAAERQLGDRLVARRTSPYLAAVSSAVSDLRGAARAVDPRIGLGRARGALAEARGEDRDRVLLEALHAWRAEVARRAGTAPAVVASDRVLSDVAHRRPTDRDALAAVLGVGPAVVDAHGDDLLGIVSAHAAPAGAP
ncbi:MAG TPA: ATP-dependent DNA helicase UvrD2 [Iamia sp.]|nr:ATP-dependent DNA helicase UvrD2 [Iamia sp.]